MRSVAELLEKAGRSAAGCVDSNACDAVIALCQAIEQMCEQMRPTTKYVAIEVSVEEAIRKDERERIAQLFEDKGTIVGNNVARVIRESAP